MSQAMFVHAFGGSPGRNASIFLFSTVPDTTAAGAFPFQFHQWDVTIGCGWLAFDEWHVRTAERAWCRAQRGERGRAVERTPDTLGPAER